MKSADLHKVWSAPDNTRLTAKQFSFRLPVHVAAKINALCDLYPNKTKTEIVGDLLSAAVEEVISGIPSSPGKFFTEDDDGTKLYEATGAIVEFRRLANKHFKELERELGSKSPSDLYSGNFVVSDKGE